MDGGFLLVATSAVMVLAVLLAAVAARLRRR